MRKIIGLVIFATASSSIASASFAQASQKDPISDYLADIAPGPVAASEMLGLTASAVTSIRAPRDFVAALNAANSSDNKTGFGLSISPARTRFAPVSIAEYVDNPGPRLWAGTSFSYAQNHKTISGADYKQQAYGIQIAFYLRATDDPAIVGYNAFVKCDELTELVAARATRLNEIRKAIRDSQPNIGGGDLAIKAKEELLKQQPFLSKALPAYQACVDDAVNKAKTKWNASQMAFSLAEGRIEIPGAGSSSLSLGRVASLGVALSPNADSLINFTVRRFDKSLDLSTISGSPSYKNSNLVGLRWTYKAVEMKDLYALVEVSNAKSSGAAFSNAFKYALGVDKRLAEGVWLELRVGRNRTREGTEEQTTALMSLKFSPQSTLPH